MNEPRSNGRAQKQRGQSPGNHTIQQTEASRRGILCRRRLVYSPKNGSIGPLGNLNHVRFIAAVAIKVLV